MVDWKKIHIFFASLGTIGGIIGFSVLTYLGNIHAGKYLVHMNAELCYAFFRYLGKIKFLLYLYAIILPAKIIFHFHF